MSDPRDLHNYQADQQQSWNADRITPAGKWVVKKSAGEGSKKFKGFDNKKIKKMLKKSIVKCEDPAAVEGTLLYLKSLRPIII